jgi:2-polyprenyl-3-methyl-5-hydroxy-6-metoxy-1,4-benzoquinol methylase
MYLDSRIEPESLMLFIDQWSRNPQRVCKEFCFPGIKILDFGCGTGFFTIPLARSGAQVTAVDRQRSKLEAIRQKTMGKELSIRLLHTDDLSLLEDKHDLILLAHVLHEIEDKKKVLGRLKGLLKEDGRLFFMEPDIDIGDHFRSNVESFLDAGFVFEKEKNLFLSRGAVFRLAQ